MRALTFVALSVLGLAACGKGCGSSGGRDAATARPPATLPQTALALLAVDDAKSVLDGFRGQFSDRATALPLPADAKEVLAGLAPLPEPLLRRVPAAAPIRTLYVADGEHTRRAIATRVVVESSPEHPLGMEVAILDGGPDGSRWVLERPSGSDTAIALYGTTLVVAENERVLRMAGNYLDAIAMQAPAGEGVSLHVFGTAFDGPLRGTIDAALEEASSSAIASAREERGRHAERAFFGDPERIVETVRDRARHFLAFLPDVSDLTLRVVAGASGVVVDGRAVVDAGSPLARALASVDVGAPFGFASLPNATAFAIASQRARGETPFVELVRPIAGSRLSAEDLTALGDAADELATMRGEPSVLALGAHADGPFLLFAAAPGAVPYAPRPLETALRADYVRALAGGIVGCETVTPPALASGRARLCRIPNGPEPTIEVEQGPDANAIVLAVRPTGATARHGATHGVVDADAASGTLFGEPDAARALAALGDRTFFAVALSARGLVPSLGLLASPRLRSLAASRALPSAAAPIVVGLARNEDGSIGVHGAAAPRAIEESYALAMLAMLLAGAE